MSCFPRFRHRGRSTGPSVDLWRQAALTQEVTKCMSCSCRTPVEATRDGRSGTAAPRLINSTRPKADRSHVLTIIMPSNNEFLELVIVPTLFPQFQKTVNVYLTIPILLELQKITVTLQLFSHNNTCLLVTIELPMYSKVMQVCTL